MIEKESENKDTDMIWFVVCEKCGVVHSAPNRDIMETAAKTHAKYCGSGVVIGPKYKKDGECVKRAEWISEKREIDELRFVAKKLKGPLEY